jgi:single-stranded-DNA-specific exonuclease
VAALRAAGIDVVVTDHHEPGAAVPEGVPVCDPKLPGGCAFPDLAGAGVALKLVHAVGVRLGRPSAWRAFVDLATIGTVGDIVPLLDENRALVSEGLRLIRTAARCGVAALAAAASVDIASLTAENIAYALCPRINAAGRMADPAIALDLLLTEDASLAAELARALDEHNHLRQATERDLMEEALRAAEAEFRTGDRLLLLAGEGWHDGVKGIVASRVTGAYGVPSLLFGIEEGTARGSGRSISGVDLHAAVSSAAELLERFGGHEAAVGVTLPAERLLELKARLSAWMAELPPESFEPPRAIDAEIELSAASAAELLERFGGHEAAESSISASHGVFMERRARVGPAANHLRFTAFDGTSALPAIFFRCPDIESVADREGAVDLAYELTADEYRGKRRIQLMVRDCRTHAASPDAPAADLVDELFGRAEEIIARGEYAGIADAESFFTKLAGVSFEGRQAVVGRLAAGTPLRPARQPDNPHDPNACALFDPMGDQVGFFNRRLAAALAPALDAGLELDVEVTGVTGGGEEGRSLGVNVLVSHRASEDVDGDERETASVRREQLAALAPRDLDAALVAHFIGERAPHPAQSEALEALEAGERCLTVMATGRGKSLIFHLHAAREAIVRGRASVFVYPLRALVADQAFHLEESLAAIGIACRAVTGESTLAMRDDAFLAMAAGELDVVMTTPEFLERNASRFAECGRVGFVAVDEAHHVGMAGASRRPAYRRLGDALGVMGEPMVLAATATAGDEIAAVVREVLGVTRVVLDPTVRDNLRVVDQRGSGEKVARLAAIAASHEKLIVYVNSREQSVRIARQLRKSTPGLWHRVAFYNGGLARPARHAVERAFREGEITAVVATSAFGEGVNIPDIRHVALFHLPFNDVEFNQMCGRAGRDGASGDIRLLYGPRDARLNEMILESRAPERDDLARLYLVLRDLAAESGGTVEMTNAELAERVKARSPKTRLTDKGVSAGLGVFRDLDLLDGEGYGAYRRLRLLPRPAEKLDIASSVRYAEGLEERETFGAFSAWALSAPAEELLARVNRPILPKA